MTRIDKRRSVPAGQVPAQLVKRPSLRFSGDDAARGPGEMHAEGTMARADVGHAAYVRGVQLSHDQQWGDALTAFQEAASLRDHPIVEINIAYCERALGRYVATVSCAAQGRRSEFPPSAPGAAACSPCAVRRRDGKSCCATRCRFAQYRPAARRAHERS